MSSFFSRPVRVRRLRRSMAAAFMAAGCVMALAPSATASTNSPQAPIHAGYKWLYSFHSGKCISVTNGSSANGVQLHQDPCANRRSFGWLPVQGFSGEEYFFRNDNSAKCMSIQNLHNGSAIVQEPCNYHNPPANERFVFIYIQQFHNYGWYLVKSVRSGLCLRLNVASKKNGAALVQHYCDTPHGQEFFLLASPGTHLPCPCTFSVSSSADQRAIASRGRTA
jgi:Ricin-type beta-trefoil lectin domain-like